MDRVNGRCQEEYDRLYSATPGTKPAADLDASFLLCDSSTDADFQAFIHELGRSPRGRQPLLAWGVEQGLGSLYPAQLWPPEEGITAIRSLESRRTQGGKKRKICSSGDLDQLSNPSNRRKAWGKPEYSRESDFQKLHTMAPESAADIPSSPKLQVHTTPLIRSSSACLTCTLMPFSLVKAFPSHETVSLADVNRRIQTCAEADASSTPSNSPGSLMPSLRGGAPATPRPQIRVDRIPNSIAREVAFVKSQGHTS